MGGAGDFPPLSPSMLYALAVLGGCHEIVDNGLFIRHLFFAGKLARRNGLLC